MKHFPGKFEVFFIILNCVFASLLVITDNGDKSPLTFFIRNLTALAITLFLSLSLRFFEKYLEQLPDHVHWFLTGLKFTLVLTIFLCIGLGTYILLMAKFISLAVIDSPFVFSIYSSLFICGIISGSFCCLVNVVFNFIKKKKSENANTYDREQSSNR